MPEFSALGDSANLEVMIISLPLGLIISLRSKGSVDFSDALLFMFGASVALFRLAAIQPYHLPNVQQGCIL